MLQSSRKILNAYEAVKATTLKGKPGAMERHSIAVSDPYVSEVNRHAAAQPVTTKQLWQRGTIKVSRRIQSVKPAARWKRYYFEIQLGQPRLACPHRGKKGDGSHRVGPSPGFYTVLDLILFQSINASISRQWSSASANKPFSRGCAA